MNKFYESDFNYKEVYNKFNSIISKLESQNCKFAIEKLMDFHTPTFYSELIPLLKFLYPNNTILEETIAEELDMISFNNHNVFDLENAIFNNDYTILDGIIFFINPLSVEASSIREGFKDYDKNELLFNKFGIIFEEQLKDLINKKNLLVRDKKFDLNELSLEKIFQDIIKNSIENSSNKVKIFLEDNSVKMQYFVDGQYLKNKENTILNINNYDKFKNVLSSKFETDRILTWKYNTSYFNILFNNADENNIYLEIHDLNKKISSIENIVLKDKELLSFKKSMDSPSGVIVISGNNDSGKRSVMYSILKYLSENKLGDNIISFENTIKNSLKYVTQINSSDIMIKNIQNFSVIAVDNNTSNKNINECFNLAAKGKLVIAVVESSSIINTLNYINDNLSNKELIVENLLSILHVGLFNKLCDSCSYTIQYNKTKKFHSFMSLENSPALSDIIKEENCEGCIDCNYGYSGRIQLCELLENDDILKDLFLNDFNVNNFKIEKRSKSWHNLFENSMLTLKEQKISLNSIIKSIGYYKK